jgi:hypothetical protein
VSFWGQALVVAALAGLVGLGEIVGRYRSDPLWALRHSIFAWFYVESTRPPASVRSS